MPSVSYELACVNHEKTIWNLKISIITCYATNSSNNEYGLYTCKPEKNNAMAPAIKLESPKLAVADPRYKLSNGGYSRL